MTILNVEIKELNPEDEYIYMSNILLMENNSICMLCQSRYKKGLLINLRSGNRYTDDEIDMDSSARITVSKLIKAVGPFKVASSADIKVTI